MIGCSANRGPAHTRRKKNCREKKSREKGDFLCAAAVEKESIENSLQEGAGVTEPARRPAVLKWKNLRTTGGLRGE